MCAGKIYLKILERIFIILIIRKLKNEPLIRSHLPSAHSQLSALCAYKRSLKKMRVACCLMRMAQGCLKFTAPTKCSAAPLSCTKCAVMLERTSLKEECSAEWCGNSRIVKCSTIKNRGQLL